MIQASYDTSPGDISSGDWCYRGASDVLAHDWGGAHP